MQIYINIIFHFTEDIISLYQNVFQFQKDFQAAVQKKFAITKSTLILIIFWFKEFEWTWYFLTFLISNYHFHLEKRQM